MKKHNTDPNIHSKYRPFLFHRSKTITSLENLVILCNKPENVHITINNTIHKLADKNNINYLSFPINIFIKISKYSNKFQITNKHDINIIVDSTCLQILFIDNHMTKLILQTTENESHIADIVMCHAVNNTLITQSMISIDHVIAHNIDPNILFRENTFHTKLLNASIKLLGATYANTMTKYFYKKKRDQILRCEKFIVKLRKMLFPPMITTIINHLCKQCRMHSLNEDLYCGAILFFNWLIPCIKTFPLFTDNNMNCLKILNKLSIFSVFDQEPVVGANEFIRKNIIQMKQIYDQIKQNTNVQQEYTFIMSVGISAPTLKK